MATKIIEYAKNKKICGGGNSEVSGTININANGTYNVARYATANVNVPPVLARGVPIEVTELPTPTAEDMGKVYLNTTNGEYYVGEEQAQEFVVGEPLGDKIYFDTSVDLIKYANLFGELQTDIIQLLLATDNSQTNGIILYFTLPYTHSDGSLLLALICMKVVNGTGQEIPVWAQGYDYSVEEFNAQYADLGISITEFGWIQQGIELVENTFEIQNSIVQMNQLSLMDNIAYKSKGIAFKPLDEPPVLQEKTVTENGVVTADAGYDGLSKVTVDVADKSITTLNALVDGSLTEFESDVVKINAYAFNSCLKLTTVSFPNATIINPNAFGSCVKLTTVNFPNVTSVGTNAFNGCSALTTVNFPKVTSISANMFRTCEKLQNANFPNATSIAGSAFDYCYSLTKVTLGTNLTTVATLIIIPAFNKCYHILGTVDATYNPTGAKDGYIYVPLALVANYRVATNWATYASQIMPYVATIEELANIDGTTYDKACVGEDYVEYTYNGTAWEVYER